MLVGVNHSPNNGTNALMDLLSIGTPTQSSSAISDLLNSGQDNKAPVSPLDVLSSPSSNSVQPTSSAGAIDLLDSFATNSPIQGKTFSNNEKLTFRYARVNLVTALFSVIQKTMALLIHL